MYDPQHVSTPKSVREKESGSLGNHSSRHVLSQQFLREYRVQRCHKGTTMNANRPHRLSLPAEHM